MTAYVTDSQCKISRNLALVIEAVLQRTPELESRIEIINVAANELAIVVGHRGCGISGQEGHGLSAIWCWEQSGQIHACSNVPRCADKESRNERRHSALSEALP